MDRNNLQCLTATIFFKFIIVANQIYFRLVLSYRGSSINLLTALKISSKFLKINYGTLEDLNFQSFLSILK